MKKLAIILSLIVLSCNIKPKDEISNNKPNNKYLIENKSVGCFTISNQIDMSSVYDNYTIQREVETVSAEGVSEKVVVYYVFENNIKVLIMRPLFDYHNGKYIEDKIGEIFVLSENYKTKDGLGVNSPITEFIKQYPEYSLWWTYVSNSYVLESESLGSNIQFLLNSKDCLIKPKTDSDMTFLKFSDFKKDARIIQIRVL